MIISSVSNPIEQYFDIPRICIYIKTEKFKYHNLLDNVKLNLVNINIISTLHRDIQIQ